MTLNQSSMASRRRHDLSTRNTRVVSLLVAAICLLTASATQAVVCPMTKLMPSGPVPVGHDKAWIKVGDSGVDQLVQWWYPADPAPNANNGGHIYSEYLLETLQANPSENDRTDPAVRTRYGTLRQQAFDRGVPLVRFNHMLAARMLAARESTPKAADWPVIWLEGDPGYADELASHGIIVVSTPQPFGAGQSLEQRVRSARAGIDETRSRFQLTLQRIGFIGMMDGAPVAARLSGQYPQAAGLALIGEWQPSERQGRNQPGYWLDAHELVAPTLHIFASDVPPNTPPKHPFDSPFSEITRWHSSDVDNLQLAYGMLEYCAPNYMSTREPDPLQVLLTQRAMRMTLDAFFTTAFDIEFKPTDMVLTALNERRRRPLNVSTSTVAAARPAPPDHAQIASLLGAGGVNELLKAVDAETQAILPASWWMRVLAQLEFDNLGAQAPILLNAWQTAQPDSGSAALQSLARSEGLSNARKEWKRVRKLVKSDPRISEEQRAQMLALVAQKSR